MDWLDGQVIWAALGASAAVLALALRRRMSRGRWALAAAAFLVLAAALAMTPWPGSGDEELSAQLPPRSDFGERFQTSAACKACHPSQYESWRETFHRTMTQPATPEAVAAPFDGRLLVTDGRAFRVHQQGEAFYVHYHGEAERPEEATAEPLKKWRVVLTTGSHNLQAYWVRTSELDLVQFPWVYVVRDGRWLPNEASFLHPDPGPSENIFREYFWSDNCVYCHTTGPEPPPEDDSVVDTAVAEIGISCEACHGPAGAHVAANRSPAQRYLSHLSASGDGTITNPEELEPAAASSLCARCHSALPPVYEGDLDPNLHLRLGDDIEGYLPFDRLHDIYDDASAGRGVRELDGDEQDALGTLWPDYTVRVAGREYNGMRLSACTTEGDMSCLSCHSMHEGDPDQLVTPGREGQEGCRPCHQGVFEQAEAHTHHPAGSPGADCLGCHMPFTSYGLLKATRSHRVDSPGVTGVDTNDRPNACNLCHLDRPLAWTADKLERWYGRPAPALDDEHHEVAAGALWIGRGDAVQRVIATWHLGRPEVQRAADVEALMPLATTLLTDDYKALRYVAADTLGRLEGYEDLAVDSSAPEPERAAAAEAILERWRSRAEGPARPELLQREGGQLDEARVEALLRDRDERETLISE